MLVTTRALTPRIGSRRAASGVLKTGTGLTTGSAGVGDCSERSRTSFCVADVVAAGAGVAGATGAGVAGVAGVATGAAGEGVVATGAGVAGVATGAEVTGAVAAFGVGGTPPRGAPAIGALVEVEFAEVFPEELFGLYVLKNSFHDGSSEVGSDK
jgi:hypothetical protein